MLSRESASCECVCVCVSFACWTLLIHPFESKQTSRPWTKWTDHIPQSFTRFHETCEARFLCEHKRQAPFQHCQTIPVASIVGIQLFFWCLYPTLVKRIHWDELSSCSPETKSGARFGRLKSLRVGSAALGRSSRLGLAVGVCYAC